MNLDVAHLGDVVGVRDRLGQVLEELAHLVRGFEIDLGRVFHPVLIHEERTRPDADHNIVGIVIGAI